MENSQSSNQPELDPDSYITEATAIARNHESAYNLALQNQELIVAELRSLDNQIMSKSTLLDVLQHHSEMAEDKFFSLPLEDTSVVGEILLDTLEDSKGRYDTETLENNVELSIMAATNEEKRFLLSHLNTEIAYKELGILLKRKTDLEAQLVDHDKLLKLQQLAKELSASLLDETKDNHNKD